MRHADGAFVDGHRHHPQRAVEVVGHGVAELTLALHVDDARPVHRRRFAAALEGVEEARIRAALVTPRGRLRHQALELGQQQVEDLRGTHLQRALLEEVAQRIGHLVARDLQDAFVHREQHRAGRLRAGELELHRLAGAGEFGHGELERLRALAEAHRERHHAIAHRAHEDLVGRRVAHELHADIAVALEVFRQLDLLHRRGGRALEPGLRIDLVTLDGDEASADIGRADAHLDLVAWCVVLFVERELQLGVALQRTADVAGAGHAVVDTAQLQAARIAQHVAVVAGLLGVERERMAGRGQGQRLLGQGALFPARLVAVGVVGLAHQHRDRLALDELQREAGRCGLLGLRVDRDELAHTLAAERDKAEVPVVLHTDEEGALGHERIRLGRHAAATFGLVDTCEQAEPVGGLVEAVELEVELGIALRIGLAFGQGVVRALTRPLRVVELVVGVGAEGGPRRAERHAGFDAAVFRRRAEEVLRVDAALQVFRVQPALARRRRKLGGDLHAVGQELLHLDGGGAELTLDLVVFHDVEVDGVGASGRTGERGVAQLGKATGGETQALALDGEAAGVEHFRFKRQAGERLAPVGGLHHHADVQALAGAVDATVGEEVGAELVGGAGVLQATHVEARVVELAVAAVERHEAHVARLAHHQQQRCTFTREAFELLEVRAAIGIGRLVEERAAVLGDDLDVGTDHRQAGVERLHEHIARAIGRLFDDDAEVGHQHQAALLQAVGVDARIDALVGRLFFAVLARLGRR